MPYVVNRHHYHGKMLPAGHVYAGRGTPLGNTVSTKQEHGAVDALALYRNWIFRKIAERDKAVLAALNSIGPETAIVCSCAPAPCHVDVVIEAWEWLAGKGNF